MKIEKTAKTVSAAIDEALIELDCSIDEIDYKVLQEPSKGFLGLFSKPAKVVIIKKDEYTKTEKAASLQSKNTNNPKKPTTKKIPKMVQIDDFEDSDLENEKSYSRSYNKNMNPNSLEIANKFLKDIFEKMSVEITINSKIDERNRLLIDLEGKDISIIIGKRGQTLYSLQYLVSLVINKGDYSYMTVILDTENYRKKRKESLENLALNLAKKVKKTKQVIKLEPMNPYERRIIHGKLQSNKEIKTYSEGKDPKRYVVISPK